MDSGKTIKEDDLEKYQKLLQGASERIAVCELDMEMFNVQYDYLLDKVNSLEKEIPDITPIPDPKIALN